MKPAPEGQGKGRGRGKGRGKGRGRGTGPEGGRGGSLRGRGGRGCKAAVAEEEGETRSSKPSRKKPVDDYAPPGTEEWWVGTWYETWAYDGNWEDTAAGRYWDAQAYESGQKAKKDMEEMNEPAKKTTVNKRDKPDATPAEETKPKKAKKTRAKKCKEPLASAASATTKQSKTKKAKTEDEETNNEKAKGKKRKAKEEGEDETQDVQPDPEFDKWITSLKSEHKKNIKEFLAIYRKDGSEAITEETKMDMKDRLDNENMVEIRFNPYWKTAACGCHSRTLGKDLIRFAWNAGTGLRFVARMALAIKCAELFVAR